MLVIKVANVLSSLHAAECSDVCGMYLLGVYLFTLVLECFQNISTVQNKSNLFVFVIQFHQHVLNLKSKKVQNKHARLVRIHR